MATARVGIDDTLHRLANYLECQLAQLLPELLADGRTSAVSSIVYRGCNLIETLREVRDGKEGGDV